MNWVDVTILTAIIASLLMGLYWGLIRQVAATLGLVLSIWVAGRFYQNVADFLHPPSGGGLIGDANMAKIVAYVGIVIVVSVGIGTVSGILRAVLNLIFLGWLDHLLGAVLGVIQMLLLMEVFLVVATVLYVPGLSDTVRSSQLAGIMLRPLFALIEPLLPPEFQFLKILQGWQ